MANVLIYNIIQLFYNWSLYILGMIELIHVKTQYSLFFKTYFNFSFKKNYENIWKVIFSQK